MTEPTKPATPAVDEKQKVIADLKSKVESLMTLSNKIGSLGSAAAKAAELELWSALVDIKGKLEKL